MYGRFPGWRQRMMRRRMMRRGRFGCCGGMVLVLALVPVAIVAMMLSGRRSRG